MEGELRRATLKGDEDKVKELLSNGANVDAIYEGGETPLLIAAGEGHTEVCKILLSWGAKVNTRDDDGFTPLVVAADQCHVEVCEILLARGARVDLKCGRNDMTPFLRAVCMGDIDICRLLMETGKIDIEDTDSNGATALNIASIEGGQSYEQHEEVMALLLARRPKLDTRDKYGFTIYQLTIVYICTVF